MVRTGAAEANYGSLKAFCENDVRLWQTGNMRIDVMKVLAQSIMDAGASERRLLIAVDGVDGSGKTNFAERLSAELEKIPTAIVHLDNFLNPSIIRHRAGRNSPDGFWMDTYNYEFFTNLVLKPLSSDGDGTYVQSAYDHATDSIVVSPPTSFPTTGAVIIEGMFLHRDELHQEWDLSIFLDVPFSITAARMAERDGTNPDPEHPSMRRYVDGQRTYFRQAQPWKRATYIVDNRDPTAPHWLSPVNSSAATQTQSQVESFNGA